MRSPANIRCPACQGALVPTQLHCDACDISVTGQFIANEFASLSAEDLHFLRIFVLCEGHIREMESALGVSYPTIKTRLAKLKENLAAGTPPHTAPTLVPTKVLASEGHTAEVLRELEAGRITFDAAMAQLKQIQKEQL